MDKSKWFVRIPFELFESSFWLMKDFSKKEAYVDLYKLANASGNSMYETRGVLVTLEEGEVGTSCVVLAERWGWDRKKVKRFLVLRPPPTPANPPPPPPPPPTQDRGAGRAHGPQDSCPRSTKVHYFEVKVLRCWIWKHAGSPRARPFRSKSST